MTTKEDEEKINVMILGATDESWSALGQVMAQGIKDRIDNPLPLRLSDVLTTRGDCVVCNSFELKRVENRAWELMDKYKPHITKPGSYEKLVERAAKDLGIELTKADIGAIAYHVASGG